MPRYNHPRQPDHRQRGRIHLWAGSKNNKVERNDFISNREQIRYVAAHDMIWGEKEGNHWSNYVGWDRNGDGLGDVRYEANDLVDRLTWRHPMMKLLLAAQPSRPCAWWLQQFPVACAQHQDPRPHMEPNKPDWRNCGVEHFLRSE